MKARLTIYILLLITVVLLAACNPNEKEVNESKNDYEIHQVEEKVIIPRVELIAGVLSQTTLRDKYGPEGDGSEYYRELESFFSEYEDHEAIRIAQKLVSNNFESGSQLSYVMTLGDLPNLKRDNSYCYYLLRKVRDEKLFEAYRKALIDLAEVSNFEAFYKSHEDLYMDILEDEQEKMNFDEVRSWMEAFYGDSKEQYCTIFAPGIFPVGGNSITTFSEDGSESNYQVIRATGEGEINPRFTDHIYSLTIHEFGHNYINPIVDTNKELIDEYKLVQLYTPVRFDMKETNYGHPMVFLNEQIIRAVTICGVNELIGEEAAIIDRELNIDRGFYLTDYTVEQIKHYQANRDLYPTFNDFVPVLLENYHKDKKELIELTRQ